MACTQLKPFCLEMNQLAVRLPGTSPGSASCSSGYAVPALLLVLPLGTWPGTDDTAQRQYTSIYLILTSAPRE